MRFLIDNSLPPAFATALAGAGHDAVHLRQIARTDLDDEAVFDLAAAQDRIIVAQDTDFGTILAKREVARPSLILFRRQGKSIQSLLPDMLTVVHDLAAELEVGAIIVIEDARIRVRRLPIA